MKFIFIISVSLVLLSNCGYHLKTQNPLINVEIIANNHHSFIDRLKKKLDHTKIATTKLHILKTQQSEQTITSNNQGQTTALRLVIKTNIKLVQIKNNKILFKGTLQQNQIIDISNNSSIDNKQKEIALQQLYNELIQQILSKIHYAN